MNGSSKVTKEEAYTNLLSAIFSSGWVVDKWKKVTVKDINNMIKVVDEVLEEMEIMPSEYREAKAKGVQCLRLRFGLEDGVSKTYEAVGQIIGVTRERIRQRVAKSLRQLRHPKRSRRLERFIVEE